jgi:hypothetical protein
MCIRPGQAPTSNCAAQGSIPSSSPAAGTDVGVLATMLGAVNLGFGIILVTDAICSSADETQP